MISTWDIINEGGVASVPVKLTLELGRQTTKRIGVWRQRMLQGSKATSDKVKRCVWGGFFFFFVYVCTFACMYIYICVVCVCGWCLEFSWLSPLSYSLRQSFLKWKNKQTKTSQSSPIKLVSLTSLPCCEDPRFPSGRPKPSGLSWETKTGSLYLYYKCLNTESSP